ncbi:MAG: beta-N-acetylhexosaminidase [Anaerolineae bacterium]|nr:beta-N-acetylhexosaminidase [Anaerolineae bacterium]
MSDVTIVPEPVSLTLGTGSFTLTPDTVILAEGAAREVAAQFCAAIAPATGFAWEVMPAAPDSKRPAITFRLDAARADLGAEGYCLTVTPKQVVALAPEPSGLFYAMQSMRQLLPPAIFRPAFVEGVAWEMPCVHIEDVPRFGWRGAMLDVCRHFMPKAFVLKFIDLLALHKLNVFHWHLTDDQGWRIEIKKYPRLTGVGAWRKESLVGHMRRDVEFKFDGIPHGGFYTQEDVREIVAYARARHITVVPEIEMPGHAQAAVAAYPELGNLEEPVEVRPYWGISENVYNVEENTFAFLQDVLDEVLALFPGEFIHVGGDEVPKVQWETSPVAQTRMRELGLANEEELQSYFIRRMDDFLTARGRRLVGWDEILEGGLAENATVMSWRGTEGGVAAAMSGHDVVMAPTHSTYLDYYQSEAREQEPLAIGGYLPLEKVYAFDPHCEGIDEAHVHHVLGTQGQLWTEYIPTPEHLEYMAFPRLCALAEVAWTPAGRKDYADFLTRLHFHLQRLDGMAVHYHKL